MYNEKIKSSNIIEQYILDGNHKYRDDIFSRYHYIFELYIDIEENPDCFSY